MKNTIPATLVFLLLFMDNMTTVYAAIDPYGGDDRVSGSNTSGFFRVEKIDGRYWLITPGNHGFFSLAHTTTLYNDTWGGFCPPLRSYPCPNGNKAKYNNSYDAWTASLLSRMKYYGFNSLGAWGQPGIPDLAENVNVLFVTNRAASLGGRMIGGASLPDPTTAEVMITGTNFPDVWDPAFEKACVSAAASMVPKATNPFVIGTFPDNELHWQGLASWNENQKSLAECYIDSSTDFHGKQYFVNSFLKGRYASVGALNKAWGTDYADWAAVLEMTANDIPDSAAYPARFADKLDLTEAIADKYYRDTTAAMRAADPNHLVFSARWALWTTAYRNDGVFDRHAQYAARIWKKAGQYCDVFALNSYIDFEHLETNFSLMTRVFQNVRKPVMITEWASFADDTAYLYNKGWQRYQKNRAAFYEKQVKYLIDLSIPVDPNDGQPAKYMVGTQWFQYYDEPSLGRMDGEKVNFGLYNVKDEAYLTCLEPMRTVNRQVYDRMIQGEAIAVLDSPMSSTGIPSATKGMEPSFKWNPVPGAAGYCMLISPEKCFPENQTLRVEGIPDSPWRDSLPMTSGLWYWSVAAVSSQGLYGAFSDPMAFRTELNSNTGSINQFLSMEDLSAWHHVALEDGGWDATVYAFADSATKTEGKQSARVVFTVNSLNKQTGLRNAQTSETALAWQGPELDFEKSGALHFDLMPARVVDASAAMTVASKYLRLRMKNSEGGVLFDQPVDAAGEFAPLIWRKVEYAFPEGVERSRVNALEFYVSCAQEAVPWDQRIAVWIDNIGTK